MRFRQAVVPSSTSDVCSSLFRGVAEVQLGPWPLPPPAESPRRPGGNKTPKQSFSGLSWVLVLVLVLGVAWRRQRLGRANPIWQGGQAGQVMRRRLAARLRDQFAQEDNGIRALRMVQ